jgi:DNA-binding GntR family transcriptional regulator
VQVSLQVQDRPASRVVRGKKKATRPLHSTSAFWALKKRIVSNHYPGGSSILEEQLASELGISRTPLKEALLKLESEGLVRLVPRRGVLIEPLTAADIVEIYSLLVALEDLAVQLIGARTDAADDLDALQADVEAMQDALREDDLDAWGIADERFHGRLVAASQNSRLNRVAETLLTQSQRFRLFTLRLRPKPFKSTRNHAALVRELKRGNVEQARAIHTGQKIGWREDMLALLKKYKITQI